MPATPLADWDHRHLWHPFTQMREWESDPDPIIVESGQGSWLTDDRGRRWLDGVGSIWTNVHGHRKPELDEAIRAQLGKVAHSTLLGLSNVPAVELAKRLADAAPRGLTRVFYSDNGATAVEVALKMAFQYWSHRGEPARTKFLRLKGSYHGDTLGAVSVGGIDLFHAAYRPLLFASLEAPNPNPLRPTCGSVPGTACVEGCLAALERMFAEHGASLAALILEPRVQGAAGILVSPPEYLARARALCDRYGVLLIADEVATGFGRTGPMWAVDSAAVVPDLMCIGKGISGGYLPLAATLATEQVYGAFLGPYESMKTFFHGHTYTGNPLACAAALASLDLFASEKIVERTALRAKHLARRLEALADHPHVGEVRQAGVMVGIELVPDRGPGRSPVQREARDRGGVVPGEYPWEERRGVRACLAAREKGVLLRPLGNVVVLNPPLSISEDEIDLLVDAARHGVQEATQEARA